MTFCCFPCNVVVSLFWQELLGRKQRLRRSTRYKPKCDYQRIIEASEPFPVSPERKRKYDKEEGEETLIVELINVHEDYVSDEDPDYVPDNDEQDDSSESSEDDDDDDEEDNEDVDEDDEQAKIFDVDETKAKGSSPQKAGQSKEAGEVNGEGNISSETETKKKENIPNKAGAKKDEKKIEAKNSDSQKTENVASKAAAKGTEKTGAASKTEGRIIV